MHLMMKDRQFPQRMLAHAASAPGKQVTMHATPYAAARRAWDGERRSQPSSASASSTVRGCSKYLAKRILLRGCLDTTAAGGDSGWPAKKEAADEESKTTVDTYPERREERRGGAHGPKLPRPLWPVPPPNRDRDCDCDCDCLCHCNRDYGCTNPRWQAQPYAPN
ncbi:hypothetical protein ColLi_11629 [Colletotrichum liriopes]|uniref:Uncharacterized protein n=1 Tax=Colletotrichum liriopes TaxID=708192 RepID=A0AA37GYL8_9PEZI|nr:hypothetical protein ColLi_11629 [Colletotrichum liriopes]